jgi:predicted GNAT family acetyltransferase
MFEKIALFKDDLTGLKMFLSSKNISDNAIRANFDILLDKEKIGYLELKYLIEEKTLIIVNFFVGSDFRNKGFAQRLYEYAIPLIDCKYIIAKAFYQAETILKKKNWDYIQDDNSINYRYKV